MAKIYCPSCNTPNDSSNPACSNCGYVFGSGAAAEANRVSTSDPAKNLRIVAWIFALLGLGIGIWIGCAYKVVAEIYPYEEKFNFLLCIISTSIGAFHAVICYGLSAIIDRLNNSKHMPMASFVSRPLAEKISQKTILTPAAKPSADPTASPVAPVPDANNPDMVVCPLCNTNQPANRACCYNCGVKFER